MNIFKNAFMKKRKEMEKSDSYYPESWLAFVLLGPPAGLPPTRRASFSSGFMADKASPQPFAVQELASRNEVDSRTRKRY